MTTCCSVFNVWPKTTLLLPMWPRDDKRLDTSVYVNGIVLTLAAVIATLVSEFGLPQADPEQGSECKHFIGKVKRTPAGE